MELEQLEPQHGWYICETITEFTCGVSVFGRYTVAIGTKGYVRANDFDPSQLQLVMLSTRGSIVARYMPLREALYRLWLTKPAPPHTVPQAHWREYWNSVGVKKALS